MWHQKYFFPFLLDCCNHVLCITLNKMQVGMFTSSWIVKSCTKTKLNSKCGIAGVCRTYKIEHLWVNMDANKKQKKGWNSKYLLSKIPLLFNSEMPKGQPIVELLKVLSQCCTRWIPQRPHDLKFCSCRKFLRLFCWCRFP